MKTMRNWFKRLRERIVYFFATKEQKFYIRVKNNRLRIIDLMSIKFDKQQGLTKETVRKLNDLFRHYEPKVDRPIGAKRITEIMYYDRHNELRLTDDAIQGLNEMFGDQSKINDTQENWEKFNQFMTKRGELCFAK